MTSNGRIRKVTESDLLTLLTWRNHSQVRSFMVSQHEISMDEHRAWFTRAAQDEKRRLLIVEDEAGPIGFVQFSDVAPGGIADWGFYARPGAPKGAGRIMSTVALNHAFSALRLHKVCGQALIGNIASIKLHLGMGFVQEGILRDQQKIEGDYRSLICFGLLEQEWRSGKNISESKMLR